MLAAPAYSVPTQDELATHAETVINAAGLPTVLYDYPQRIGVQWNVEALTPLADHELVVGIKEASGDLSRIDMLQENFAGRIDPVCGADTDSVVFFEKGVTSWIGGIGNALPKAHLGILDPATRAQAHAAVTPLFGYIEEGRYIQKVKAFLAKV